MTYKPLARVAGGALVAASLLAGSSVALAQMYDTGAPGSGSAGTIIPSAAITPTGSADTNAAQGTSPSSAAGTPGIPNTGARGDLGTTLLVLGTAALIATAGIVYAVRQRPRQA